MLLENQPDKSSLPWINPITCLLCAWIPTARPPLEKHGRIKQRESIINSWSPQLALNFAWRSVSLSSSLFCSPQYCSKRVHFSPTFFRRTRRQEKTLLSTLQKWNQFTQKGTRWEIPQPPAITPTSLSAFTHILSSFPYSMEEGPYSLSRSNLTTSALNNTLFCLQNCH